MVNNRSSLDPRWVTQTGLKPSSGFMVVTLQVVRKDQTSSIPTYDQSTRTWSGGNYTTIWTGKARLQPTSFDRPELVGQDQTYRETIRIQIPAVGTNINVDDRIVVVESPYDHSLENYSYTVTGLIGTSTMWGTTITANADLKRNPS
jgi:hypothetical protein